MNSSHETFEECPLNQLVDYHYRIVRNLEARYSSLLSSSYLDNRALQDQLFSALNKIACLLNKDNSTAVFNFEKYPSKWKDSEDLYISELNLKMENAKLLEEIKFLKSEVQKSREATLNAGTI